LYDHFYFLHIIQKVKLIHSIPQALALLCSLSTAASAHEYWVDRDNGQYVLHQGHKTAVHRGAASIAYDPASVVRVECLDESGKSRVLIPHGTPVRVDGSCAAVNFYLDHGYWTKTAYDTLNKPKNEVKGALQSWRSHENVTRLNQWTAALAQPAGVGLVLSLPANPDRLKTGDKFTVVVTLDGAPRADVPVAYAGETRGVTDAGGRINLKIRHTGLQQISASLEAPLTDGKADTLIRAATLNFMLP
jgi:nickel transport protein